MRRHRLQHAVVGDVPDRPRHLARRIAVGLVAVVALGFMAYSINQDLRHGSSVTQAISQLTPGWIAVLVVGAVLVMLLTTGTTAAPLPGLGFQPAFLAQHASQAVGNLVPGPSALAVRFTMLRTYGVDGDDFARATVTVSLVTTVMTASMPIVGMSLLALIGAQDPEAKTLLPAAIWATVLAVVVMVGVGVLLGSERATAAIARGFEAIRSRVAGLWRRRVREGPAAGAARGGAGGAGAGTVGGADGGVSAVDGALRLRTRLIEGLRASGRRVVAVVALLYWANGLLMVLSLWAAGVPRGELGLVAGLAVYTIGRLSTLVQITPGGIGVVEVAYTAAYTAYLGQEYQGTVFAGVVLYRLGTYALPIVVGLVSAGVWAATARREFRDEVLVHAAGLDEPEPHGADPGAAADGDPRADPGAAADRDLRADPGAAAESTRPVAPSHPPTAKDSHHG